MPSQTETVAQGVPVPVAVAIGCFFAIACYNSIEIYVFALGTFRRKNTLYFWTMMVANTGILLHEIPAALRFFKLAPNVPMVVITSLGWWMMTTGQSVVLYSRLYLVINDNRKIRWALIMIATTFFVFQLPTTITFIGMNATPSNRPDIFTGAFNVLKIGQLAAFMVQESVLSGLYAYVFRATSEPMRVIREKKVQNLLRQMIALFVLVLMLDVVLIVNECLGHFRVQTTLKPAVYSVKLKVELFVLNNLVILLRSPTPSCWSLPTNQSLLQQDQKDRASTRNTTTLEAANSGVSLDLREPPSCTTMTRSRTG